MLNSYYIALDFNSTDVLEGSPYFPNKDQFIAIPNVVLPFAELTIELNFFWTGFQIGQGKPKQPLFFFGNPDGTYLFITPRSNPSGVDSNAIGGLYLGNGANVQLVEIDGYQDNRWVHMTIGWKAGSGASYVVMSTWDRTLYVDGVPAFFTANFLPNSIIASTVYIGQVAAVMRSTLGVVDPFAGKVDEFRIWNKFMDFATVKAIRQTSLIGKR